MEHTGKVIENLSNHRNTDAIPDGRNAMTITTLVDNNAPENLASEHGLSFWIEYNDKHIIFDTGQSDAFVKNAKQLGIKPAETDAIVISHGHYDHTGGLAALLDIAPQANLYIHPEALKPKFSRKGNRNIGISDSIKKIILQRADQKKVIWTEKPTEIFPGLFTTGKIPRNTGFEDTGGNFFVNVQCTKEDRLVDDQAIFTETGKGLVVVLGCAHSGVINTLDYAEKLTSQNHIYAVIGGMHLLNASPERMESTIDAFKRYNVKKICPAHCTGDNAVEKFKQVFAERCFICSAGSRIHL
jgi:7,8-dihydropterin-6-yl-methyl-4-(beta-D-ribofuranosyl)aminobenzene 5'-phosphate synthase